MELSLNQYLTRLADIGNDLREQCEVVEREELQ